MHEVLLATRNVGKVRELRELTRGMAIAWRGLDEFPDIDEPAETGATLDANARLKGLYYAAATHLPALADDSGLEVDALGGRPGVNSATFAGVPRDDAANNRALLAALADAPPPKRTARFRCVLALAIGDQIALQSEGVLEGAIAERPRGANGFGYDPLFLIPELGRTSAELTPAGKNAISHRARALAALLPQLAAALDAATR